MDKITITEILDDLRAADAITRRYERHFWLSSADFYELYKQGLLDDGEHTDEFSEWSAYYQIKMDRETMLAKLSAERMRRLKTKQTTGIIEIDPREPALSIPMEA
jgi:hypothetical protein